MDIKEAERVVIAKPVATRPTCSNFMSFSELLAGAINSSPPEAAVTASVRPKTVRVKPIINRASTSMGSSQAEFCGTAASSDKIPRSDTRPTVLYKPQAKLVSKTTISILSNMGNVSTQQTQPMQPRKAQIDYPKHGKLNYESRVGLNLYQSQSAPVHREADQLSEPSRLMSQNQGDDSKSSPLAANGDRPSYDGYNWRKYGQKQVKGSEYPRSYYKCTHPNCPVKKMVERSFDGQIAEIVYKGEHNHAKPQPPKRSSFGTQALGLANEGTGQDTNTQLWNNLPIERNETSEGRVENQNEMGLPAYTTRQGKSPLSSEPAKIGLINAGAGTPDNSCSLSGECNEGSRGMLGNDEPRSKRRRSDNQSNEAGTLAEVPQEPRVVVQSFTEPEILGDGFRWRKYGQKVVKGNPYPRSYYRCTSIKCNVRKHVERASDDPKAFITTYEGKHNHEMPLRSTNTLPSESDSQLHNPRD